MISPADLRALESRLDSLSPQDAQVLLASLGAEIDRACAANGLLWLRFVKTRDETDPDNSVKLFPLLPYTKQLWKDYVENDLVVVAKSRQMIVSWATAAFCVWTARYKPNRGVYWQTKAWEDAVAMICMPSGPFKARCQFIEDNLPAWMRQDYKASEGRMQYPNGSVIQALAGGRDKIRSKTASLIVEDEFAHQEDQDGVYTAVAPLVKNGVKAFFISSPNGTGNMFATLYHGRPVGEERPE